MHATLALGWGVKKKVQGMEYIEYTSHVPFSDCFPSISFFFLHEDMFRHTLTS